MGITHSFTSTKSDGGDSTLVKPSDWNATHVATDVTLTEETTPSSPASGKQTVFIDSADHIVKTVNSSGTVLSLGGGGSLVLLEQHTASSSASLDFTSSITSTYDDYLIEMFNVIPATDGASLNFRFSTNGGSTYDSGSNYMYSDIRFNSFGSAVQYSSSATSILIDGQGGSAVGVKNTTSYGGVSGSFWLYNPLGTASYKTIRGHQIMRNATDLTPANVSGMYLSTSAVNAFRFLFSSGNITSGTIRVYGISKTVPSGITTAYDHFGLELLAPITTGVKGEWIAKCDGTITDWVILSDASCSIQFDLWKGTYTNYPPTVTDTITGSAKPLVSSASKASSSTLTGWTAAFTKGDIIRFNVDSITLGSAARITLTVNYTK